MSLYFCVSRGSQEVFVLKKVCFRVPTLIDRFPGPNPDPWIQAEELRQELAHDLSAIATVQAVVESMSPQLGRYFQSGLEQAHEAVAATLPEGASLERTTHSAS